MAILYDPKKIYRFASRMYSDAIAFEIFGVVLMLFCLFGSWYLIHVTPHMVTGFDAMEYHLQVWALGIAAGIALILAGHSHAENLRAQAQLLLCQVEIERNTANFVHDAIIEKPTVVEEKQQEPVA